MNTEQRSELTQLATGMEQAANLLSQINTALVKTIDYHDPDEDRDEALMDRLFAAQDGLEEQINRYTDDLIVGWLMEWLPENGKPKPRDEPKPQADQPWSAHTIVGLKNPKFFQRKVGDLSLQELEAIESQWLPKVRQVWDHVSASQKSDAIAFEAAIAARRIPEHIRAKLKRLCPYIGYDIPESVRQKAQEMFHGGGWVWRGAWWWDDGGDDDWQCQLHLCDMDSEDINDGDHVAIRPIENGQYLLFFLVDGLEGDYQKDLIFPNPEAAKHFLDPLLAFATPPLPLLPLIHAKEFLADT